MVLKTGIEQQTTDEQQIFWYKAQEKRLLSVVTSVWFEEVTSILNCSEMPYTNEQTKHSIHKYVCLMIFW